MNGMRIVSMLLHALKAFFSIFVTVSGMYSSVIESAALNAKAFIVSTGLPRYSSGIDTFASLP